VQVKRNCADSGPSLVTETERNNASFLEKSYRST